LQWAIPRELLWAIIFGLAVTVAVLWPSHYPYSQAPQIDSEQQAKNGIGSNGPAQHRPTAQIDERSYQQNQHGSEGASEIAPLGIKPGEWLLSFVTLMLWGATVRLIRGSERTAQRQLRAYVFVTNAGIDNFGQGVVPRLAYKYMNTGQTPAYKVIAVSAIIIRKRNDLSPFPNPKDTPTYTVGEHSKLALGPQMFLNSSPNLANTPLTADEIKGIIDGTLTLYFFGEIKYRDGFGEDRFTRFRYSYGKKNVGGRGLNVTAEGNETEEESKP
jgi:hypothetical protein